jgi:hypothetical protein
MLEHISQLNSAVESSKEFIHRKAEEDPYELVILGLLVGVAASTLGKKEVASVLGLFGRAITTDAIQYFLEKVENKRELESQSSAEAIH